MSFFIDTHCHLNFNSFENDLPAVLERARVANVRKVIVPATDLETSRSAIELCIQYGPDLFAAVGMHPNDTSGWESGTIYQLRKLAASQQVKAIGEIGLDYYRDKTEHGLQKTIFLSQLDLAAELGLPVVVHNRSAAFDLWSILQKWVSNMPAASHGEKPLRGVLHSFDGELSLALEAIDAGFLLGISGPITYANAGAKREILTHLPLEALLLETDAPFLTPHPFRGKRNEPAYIPLIAAQIAKVKQIGLADVQLITTKNAVQLFSLGNLD